MTNNFIKYKHTPNTEHKQNKNLSPKLKEIKMYLVCCTNVNLQNNFFNML